MEELVVNGKYLSILNDELFRKTILVRAKAEFNKSLMKVYRIPISNDIDPDDPWNQKEVISIVNALKMVYKTVDKDAVVRFMALLEAIAGKRNMHKLFYLVSSNAWVLPNDVNI